MLQQEGAPGKANQAPSSPLPSSPIALPPTGRRGRKASKDGKDNKDEGDHQQRLARPDAGGVMNYLWRTVVVSVLWLSAGFWSPRVWLPSWAVAVAVLLKTKPFGVDAATLAGIVLSK